MNAYLFSVVAVRRGDQFVLVQERKHGQRWYLPAGRVEPGETFECAARREVLEEAGIDVALTGLIGLEQSNTASGVRLRAVFTAEPVGDSPLKSSPDKHTLQAVWVRPSELGHYDLRGVEVASLLEYLAAGGPTASLEVLRREGSDYTLPQVL
ncbi:NADH pyrophosphatase [Posidoniimonas polymericola]|uniref:NADH pyrophosphatase n=1 Tax=Posidoniimonas polymericola TaxID=2528002 RepID=A0A5C5XWA6_9BACT|nr:NUDIX domain-containing protein [Posidoniimonas polymericola]TWT66978.1 NADH pyrophosphatase [Posidoniimonas polymericola]